MPAAAWAAFLGARDDRAFLQGWLTVLLGRVPDASFGVVLDLDRTSGALKPVAAGPDPARDLAPLRPVAERSAATGRAATGTGDDGRGYAAVPARTGGGPMAGLVVLELRSDDPAALQAAVREVHWAIGWLTSRHWQGAHDLEAEKVERAGIALDLLALVHEHPRPEAAAMALVNELKGILHADQVSVGMVRGRRSPRVRLLAMSYAAWFKRRSTLAESLETMMDEAFDQGVTVAAPPVEGLPRAVHIAHADHLRTTKTSHVLSVPMQDDARVVGVICAERRADTSFTPREVRIAESVAALMGPILELKRRNRRWIGGRLVDKTGHVLGILLGPRRLSWKLLALAIGALILAAATVDGPFRVSADAVLQGEVRRAAVAPLQGFVAEAAVRAGDRVEEDALLARLDDRDLRLEQLRWQSEIDRLSAQSRTALAEGARDEVAYLEAQIRQARARLALAQAELDRTEIRAPIGGLVIAGDLSQRLGSPVQQGEVLFEIAPLDSYRLEVFVDERDLPYISAGMGGDLVLTGRPTEPLPFEIERITPVSEAREAGNVFLAEARLTAPAPGDLRPGMAGSAKVEAGRALYAWSWTRRLRDWLRTTLWTWQP
ncbi:HlyD family efflux transporter periplasmic adaptor subunit [Histidinibacterium lentulum]|uniref:HlyD family efflux transporter periplasmic adaptor subunit n=1 Tax=Histidinibacterium lentulum TaxID=2480588 RepID=A0A3N2QW27_9RHOB|nr:HlyD family efflux transporter periplasmic adaptor subunit [Histidinibacterium lentulum]ROT99433.1 HlyD family efflux transporter periplasmic adaptor subunit [Histidinibacterium lentulum]